MRARALTYSRAALIIRLWDQDTDEKDAGIGDGETRTRHAECTYAFCDKELYIRVK